MFLAESCIPPTPIARGCFWFKLCDEHYNLMSDEERLRAFEWISPKLDLDVEYCRLFFARFNPKNQYLANCFHLGKVQQTKCFRYNDEYHTSRSVRINPDYIKSVEKLF